MRRAGLALALGIATLGGSAVSDQRDPRLDPLFSQLAQGDALEAARAEQAIWEIWLESGDDDTDRRMTRGVRAMNRGDFGGALAAFESVVEAAPGYAEGWNKRATLYWLMGQLDASVADIDRTLALEPRHFGALSGLAMIREAQGRPFEALEALEKVVKIHPKLPHLGERIDHLTRQLGEPI